MSLRWLTAGESHGPALTAVLEGLPAGVETSTKAITDALARRRLGYGRGARMKFEQDQVTILGGVRHGLTQGGPGRDSGRQHRVAQVGDGHGRRSGRPRGAGRAGAQRPADPAPSRPRRPGRHAEVRLRRRPAGPGAGLGPRDRRAGRARRGGAATSCGRPSAPRSSPTWSASAAPSRRATPSLPLPADVDEARRRPGALPGPAGRGGDGRRDRPGAQGRRHARRRRRGRRLRPAAGPGLARAVGPPAGRQAGRRAHGHPGHQGRRDRRRLRCWPRIPGSQAHDEMEAVAGRPAAGPPRAPAAAAAPRAACPPARCCACAPR